MKAFLLVPFALAFALPAYAQCNPQYPATCVEAPRLYSPYGYRSQALELYVPPRHVAPRVDYRTRVFTDDVGKIRAYGHDFGNTTTYTDQFGNVISREYGR